MLLSVGLQTPKKRSVKAEVYYFGNHFVDGCNATEGIQM